MLQMRKQAQELESGALFKLTGSKWQSLDLNTGGQSPYGLGPIQEGAHLHVFFAVTLQIYLIVTVSVTH